MSIQYHKARQDQLPVDLSALGNLKVAVEENNTGTTDQEVDIVEVGGMAQTARNWSLDFANLGTIALDTANLDVALSTVAKEVTALAIKTAVESIAAEDFATEATLTALANTAAAIALDTANLDTALSSRASEATVSAINGKLNSLGQKANAGSMPVSLSTEQAPVLDAINANTLGSQNNLSDVKGKLDTVNGNLSGAGGVKEKLDSANSKLDAANTSLDNIESDADATKIAAQAIATSNDVARSTRASESTVNDVKANTNGTNVRLDTANGHLANIKANTDKLDVTLIEHSKRERWGRNLEPAWTHGAEATDPADSAVLVTKAVSGGVTGHIYGFYISSAEDSHFKINWTSGGGAKSVRIVHASKGTTMYTDKVPLTEGQAADASTNMTITKIGNGTGVFQAGLLTAEV